MKTTRHTRIGRDASLLLALTLALLAGCSRVPKNARGQTPIRYVRCNPEGKECTVAARFESMRTCERYLRIDSAKCDETRSDKIVCDLSYKPPASSYCMP